MPRTPEPRWHEKRRRWVSNIGEADAKGNARTVYFPRADPATGRPIGEKDKPWAYEFMARYLKAKQTPRVQGSSVPAFGDILDAYQGDLQLRAASGLVTTAYLKSCKSLIGKLAAYRDPKGRRLLDVPCDQLTSVDLDGVVERLRGLGRTPHYIDSFCRLAMAALNWAATAKPDRKALIPANPFVGFKAPTLPVSPERFAERGIAARWLWYLRSHANGYKAGSQGRRYARSLLYLVWLLVRSGARPGEACTLRWSDLRLSAGRTAAGHPMGRAQIPPERWKTGGQTGKMRTIYLYPPLVRLLRRLSADPDRHPTNVFVHGRGRGGKGAGEPWESGSALSKTITRHRRELIEDVKAINERIKAAGQVDPVLRWLAAVDLSDEGPNRIVNYLWRHTAASTLIMLGVDVATVAEQLGTSVEMLRKHYAHLLDSHVRSAAESLAYRRLGQ